MSTVHQRPVDTRTLAGRGATALGLALAVNLVLAWVTLSGDLVDSTEFLQYPAVVLWTTLGIVGATVVYGVLTRRVATPDRTFVRVAAAVFVLSFAPDIGLALFVDSVTTSEAVGLMALHVPPAVAAILVLPDTRPVG